MGQPSKQPPDGIKAANPLRIGLITEGLGEQPKPIIFDGLCDFFYLITL
jgi:hypothetical protein